MSAKKTNKQTKTSAAAAKTLQSCPTLCNPVDGSLPGFSVPGILQARTLEWVAISFSNKQKHKNAQKAKEEINGKDISGKIIYEVGSRRMLNT